MLISKSNKLLLQVLTGFLLVFQAYGKEQEGDDDMNDVNQYEDFRQRSSGIMKTNYTIKDIESFKPIDDEYLCPPESTYRRSMQMKTREGEEFYSCRYQYFCHNKGCSGVYEPMGVDFDAINYQSDNDICGKRYPIFENKNKSLIMISCSKKRQKRHKCGTSQCTSNEDCFSENCVNGICMTNKDDPIYACETVMENARMTVKCLLSLEEKCEKNEDCAFNANCTKDKLCVIERVPEEYPFNYTLAILGSAALLALICLFIYWQDKKAFNKYKNNNNNNNNKKTT